MAIIYILGSRYIKKDRKHKKMEKVTVTAKNVLQLNAHHFLTL